MLSVEEAEAARRMLLLTFISRLGFEQRLVGKAWGLGSECRQREMNRMNNELTIAVT